MKTVATILHPIIQVQSCFKAIALASIIVILDQSKTQSPIGRVINHPRRKDCLARGEITQNKIKGRGAQFNNCLKQTQFVTSSGSAGLLEFGLKGRRQVIQKSHPPFSQE